MPQPAFKAFPPEVVGQRELEQGRKDEGRAGAHPDVDGLWETRFKGCDFKDFPGVLAT
jgi:hypothetical protein